MKLELWLLRLRRLQIKRLLFQTISNVYPRSTKLAVAPVLIEILIEDVEATLGRWPG